MVFIVWNISFIKGSLLQRTRPHSPICFPFSQYILCCVSWLISIQLGPTTFPWLPHTHTHAHTYTHTLSLSECVFHVLPRCACVCVWVDEGSRASGHGNRRWEQLKTWHLNQTICNWMTESVTHTEAHCRAGQSSISDLELMKLCISYYHTSEVGFTNPLHNGLRLKSHNALSFYVWTPKEVIKKKKNLWKCAPEHLFMIWTIAFSLFDRFEDSNTCTCICFFSGNCVFFVAI